MLALLLSARLALAAPPTCEGAPTDWLQTLTAGPDLTASMCLGYVDAAHDPLLAAAAEPPSDRDVANRLSRALAVHLMLRLDRAITPEESRPLNGADRRLLRDAVYARRGRRTPSAAHAAVFERFDWYQPDDQFNNRRLTDLDRANLAMIDSPPAPPPDAGPSAADAVADSQDQPAVPQGMCGCAAGSTRGASWAWLLGLLAVVVGARRRRDDAPSR